MLVTNTVNGHSLSILALRKRTAAISGYNLHTTEYSFLKSQLTGSDHNIIWSQNMLPPEES